MSKPATSLDRLNDLALPPEVPWWPPAPAWYLVIGLALLLAIVLGVRGWQRWQANAYRRAARRELATMESASEIASLLRRTALASTPRELVASMHGKEWLAWLSARSRDPMPDDIGRQLDAGIYAPPGDQQSIEHLRNYAARWISHHRTEANPGAGPASPSISP